jgi:predicted nucleotidyltransferase component of viral defense system
MPRVTLTRALVNLHGAGRADTYDAALLDVAQDHLLWSLAELGLFNDDGMIFKGGTSLRKCRLGGAGRFSTDLDFACPSEEIVLAVCEAIDGASISGFRFSLESTRGDGRHWTLPVHRGYDVQLPSLPVIAEAEACAEKLARYRRTALGRDVYDLAQFARRPMNEPLVRRLWVLKVWGDVVDEGRGTGPLDPADILTERREQDFAPESIGKLTQAGNVPSDTGTDSWLSSTRASVAGLHVIPVTGARLRPPWLPEASRRVDGGEIYISLGSI